MELPQNCQTAAELWHIDISCLQARPSLLLFTPVSFVLLSADEATGYGVARGKNHHELQGPGQSTCHIQVTYVPHKPSLITARCASCVAPIAHHLPGCIHTGLGSACK